MLIKERRVSDLNPIYVLADVTGWYQYHTTKLDLCSWLIYLKTFIQEAVQTGTVLSLSTTKLTYPVSIITSLIYCNLLFCWPYITVYQYSETNVTHFLFNLLRITGLNMFQAVLAHPQEVLHKRHLVYCMHVISVGCNRIGVELEPVPLQSWCSQLT
jgi:hypothetical protein